MMKKEKTVAKYTIELHSASSDDNRKKKHFCTLFALFSIIYVIYKNALGHQVNQSGKVL